MCVSPALYTLAQGQVPSFVFMTADVVNGLSPVLGFETNVRIGKVKHHLRTRMIIISNSNAYLSHYTCVSS